MLTIAVCILAVTHQIAGTDGIRGFCLPCGCRYRGPGAGAVPLREREEPRATRVVTLYPEVMELPGRRCTVREGVPSMRLTYGLVARNG